MEYTKDTHTLGEGPLAQGHHCEDGAETRGESKASVIYSRLFSSLSPSMPRPRYRIIAAGVKVVHRWIRERLRNDVWPEDWLRLMQAVIKASRRDPSRYRTVRLSRNAHEILRKLAMRDKLTLSKVVERYLSCVAHTPAKARLI